MKVSRRGEYGIRAMLELARHYGRTPLHSRDIAARQGIPEPYLNQLLTVLHKAGLIISRRGPGGGHTLARPPEAINLGELVAALEGSLSPASCVEPGDGSDCEMLDTCALRQMWLEVKQATDRVLTSTTLAHLLERERQRALTYSI